ncbi:MAG: DASH family cryptochrome [Halioglobus sp.]|nr:DASH family cryptochrome [Halioglobus sp.]
MRHLYWFRNDLRLNDNPGLLAQGDADRLLLVYLWPTNRPWCNVTGMGEQRERFLTESVQSLRESLLKMGQDLLVLHGSPEVVIPELVRDYSMDRVGTSRAPGYYERRTVELLRQRLPVPLNLYDNGTLFCEDELPFELDELPPQFTPFKEQVEELSVATPVPRPDNLPRPPAAPFMGVPASSVRPHTALPIRGGSLAGNRRLRQFVFEDQAITTYKETRNCLDGLAGSSTLSPWLATGSLSPREIAAAIRRFESGHVRNESTYWLFFELLWREFFQWRAYRDDIGLFRAGGGRKRLTRCTFEPRSFSRWCAGDTDYPIVNAIMRQLMATGWASNRGRQIAASCLVNELQLDWRYGAAFFEKHLIDYDVASNYGNWQYLAGVGADPRGGRHFNLQKQTLDHDPEGVFIQKWGGNRPPQPLHVTDAADWPIVDP